MRILVVDDDEGIREMVCFGLEGYTGFQVRTAVGDGDVDVAAAAACDLVIMDMHLGTPEDGLDLIEQIAAINPHVRFLVMSGRKEIEVASRVVAASKATRVIDTLIKPFEMEQLFIAVDRALSTD
jgi:two-component system, OmpR family, response regulator